MAFWVFDSDGEYQDYVHGRSSIARKCNVQTDTHVELHVECCGTMMSEIDSLSKDMAVQIKPGIKLQGDEGLVEDGEWVGYDVCIEMEFHNETDIRKIDREGWFKCGGNTGKGVDA